MRWLRRKINRVKWRCEAMELGPYKVRVTWRWGRFHAVELWSKVDGDEFAYTYLMREVKPRA
jgi:hypothetical protein